MRSDSIVTKPFFFVLLFISFSGILLMTYSSLKVGQKYVLREDTIAVNEIVEIDGQLMQKVHDDDKGSTYEFLSDSSPTSISNVTVSSTREDMPSEISSDEQPSQTSAKWILDETVLGVSSGDFLVSDESNELQEEPSIIVAQENIETDLEPQNLKVWVTYNDEQFRLYKRLVKDFENKHQVRINVFRIPFHGQGEKIMYACSSRTAPDIARMDIGLIPKFAAGNALLSLDDLGLKEFESELLEPALDAGRVYLPNIGTKSYAIPDEFTTLALYYNKEMFINVGLDQNRPPTNWLEFIDYAKKLTIDKDGDGRIDQYGFAMEITPWWSMPFLFSFQGKVLDEETMECKLSESGAVKALKFQVDLSNKLKVEGGAWRSGAITPDMGFKNKVYAMILNGPWNLENFKNANLNFGVSLIPGNSSLGIKSKTNVGGNANVIFKSSKSPRLAMKFLRYLSSKEVQLTWMQELGAIPINKKVSKLALQNNNIDQNLRIFMEQATFAEGRPKIPGYDKIDRIISNEMETAFSGDRTPEEAMVKACKMIRETVISELKSN